jgi:hypothetical protein
MGPNHRPINTRDGLTFKTVANVGAAADGRFGFPSHAGAAATSS